MNNSIIVCQALSKVYQEGKLQTPVLHGVNLAVDKNELLAIVGTSGSGKSTLLHLLGSLDSPSQGTVIFNGTDIHSMSAKQQAQWRNQELGFIYQFHHLLSEFTALENVAMPLYIAGIKDQQAQQQARELLIEVGLGHRLAHFPGQLSGGERQRVAIARALINQPKILLADEPTGNLDDATGEEIYQLLATLKAQHEFAAVVVTHDLRLAQKLDTQYRLIKGTLSTGLA